MLLRCRKPMALAVMPAARGNIAYIGPVPERALGLEIAADKINRKVLSTICTIIALTKPTMSWPVCVKQKSAVARPSRGHEAFQSGMSEFDINQAYLTATGHRDTDVLTATSWR